MQWNAVVPELTVFDYQVSLDFYTRLLGFSVCYTREEPRFAYLELEAVQLMIEEWHPLGWHTGELVRPYGRGINLQLELADVEPQRTRLLAAGTALFRPVEDAWYEADGVLHGQRQLLVQDPDGYLLRLCQVLGERALD